MSYTRKERLDTGKQIYNNELSYSSEPDLSEYESMTKEELIKELVKSRISEARLKKGYEVKGDGAQKTITISDNRNMK